jgi:hypothetical protein
MARVEVAARVQDVDSLKFDFNPAFDILRVYDKAGRELFYTQDKSRQLLYIFLLQPLEKGQQTSIEVFYRGTLEPPIQTTDVLSDGQFESQISLIPPNYDNYLYSHSALWYPSSSEQDYFQSRLRISIPPDYVCVANGELVEEATVDEVRRVFTLEKIGNRISIFETRKPLKYLSFIVGKFDRTFAETQTGEPVLRLHVSEDIRGTRKNVLEDTRAVIQVYAGIFGPFPYEKLSIVQRVWPSAGGHSPASFLVLNELSRNQGAIMISDPQSPVDLPRYKEYILAHEIAHQWWGQALTGATYHDQWLSEGLAQYAAVRFLKTRYGEKSLPSILNKYVDWTEKKSHIGPITLGSRLSLFDFKGYQAVLYGKTCVALFLLSDLIGEDVFDRGLRAFFEAQSFQRVYQGDGSGLRAHPGRIFPRMVRFPRSSQSFRDHRGDEQRRRLRTARPDPPNAESDGLPLDRELVGKRPSRSAKARRRRPDQGFHVSDKRQAGEIQSESGPAGSRNL